VLIYNEIKYQGIKDKNKEEKEPCSLSKIYLLFDAENPLFFCKKAKLACKEWEILEYFANLRYRCGIHQKDKSRHLLHKHQE